MIRFVFHERFSNNNEVIPCDNDSVLYLRKKIKFKPHLGVHSFFTFFIFLLSQVHKRKLS